jgi:glycerol-3-phosphate dehydrogenase
MNYLVRLNKHLRSSFKGRVSALERDGCLFLEGELDDWADIVRAGSLAVHFRKRDSRLFLRELQKEAKPDTRLGGVVNDIRYSGGREPMRLPVLQDDELEGQRPDVLVIGGGISGCTIARELSRYALDILLLEKEHDLAMQASSRNDGMVHPGVDLRKGSWKYHYN